MIYAELIFQFGKCWLSVCINFVKENIIVEISKLISRWGSVLLLFVCWNYFSVDYLATAFLIVLNMNFNFSTYLVF